MKCLDDCHTYEMESILHRSDPEYPEYPYWLRFYEMRKDGTKIDGVTNEEVLNVLIHRISILNAKIPCVENAEALLRLTEALEWLETRTEGREARGVEGTMNP